VVRVMPMVMVVVVMVHGAGERGAGKQQQSGNDDYFLHDDELYLENYWGCMPARTGRYRKTKPN